jgi:hypothetical protein
VNQSYFVWRSSRSGSGGRLAAPASPSSPSNQPQRFLAVVGNGVRSCFTQPFFPILNFCFRKSQLANFLPMTESMVNVGQTARLPMLRVFRKIEPKETGCRLLLNRI